jgi:hypothetical protein
VGRAAILKKDGVYEQQGRGISEELFEFRASCVWVLADGATQWTSFSERRQRPSRPSRLMRRLTFDTVFSAVLFARLLMAG